MKLLGKPLTQEQISTIVTNKIEWVLHHCSPQNIYLFGSEASAQMTDASDVDMVLVFENELEMNQAKKSLAINRPKNDWPHDLLFHTTESFDESVSKGGGASWIAKQEGQLLFSKGKT